MLTSKQLCDIKELQQACEAGEDFQLKLNWDMLQTRPENEVHDFFHYENEKLVGFIGLYGFGNKVELCGMVHPDYRRKGIFTQLFNEAEKLMAERKYKVILLNAPTKSESAKGFIQTIPCTYSISEHQMQWHEKELEKNEEVTLRPAEPQDLELEIQLEVQCFGFEEDEAREYNQQPRLVDEYYMIESGDKAVGKMRVSHTNGEAWIYGFAVLPEYQGKGIGRKALTNVIVDENRAGNPIFLEVEAKNDNALRLYESCGFKAYHSQDYYKKL
ncbi:GNAT family N-acetyltransferase [Bacillus sp. CGMCC 1.16607]|uniref:GNAT family N-acetyltransferase n=1 Tax=Bacillus sp. CGMCC 1.16607 TaxID=3351842 RepID=UPI003629086F